MQSNVNFSVCLVFSKEWSLSFKAMLGYDKTERSMQARSRLSVFGLFLGGGGGGGGGHFPLWCIYSLRSESKIEQGPGGLSAGAPGCILGKFHKGVLKGENGILCTGTGIHQQKNQ